MSQGFPRSKGHRGHAVRQMAAILDSMSLFGFGFRDVIDGKETPMLPLPTPFVESVINVTAVLPFKWNIVFLAIALNLKCEFLILLEIYI